MHLVQWLLYSYYSIQGTLQFEWFVSELAICMEAHHPMNKCRESLAVASNDPKIAQRCMILKLVFGVVVFRPLRDVVADELEDVVGRFLQDRVDLPDT